MTRATKTLLGTAIGAAALALSAASASALVACNGDVCWHVKERYTYEPTFGITVHPDDWKWEDKDKARYRWHEHEGEGRGYWKGGVWLTF